MEQVLVLATLETKSDETSYLMAQISKAGVTARVIDISLNTAGRILPGEAKTTAMIEAAASVSRLVTRACEEGARVVVGIGGGTGGEIALNVIRDLPITLPKVLCSTMPFDPRGAVADNSIILVPTLADIAGLNDLLRDALDKTALLVAGLCKKRPPPPGTALSVGISALGATDGAVRPLVEAFRAQDRETIVFHANGFGGAAFARCLRNSTVDAVVDLTPHELTRIHLAGACVPMPDRFTAGGHLPRVVLPGAMNFIGLAEKSLLPDHYLNRPHYEHSGYFTHVKVTPGEMEKICLKLADDLNALSGPCAVILPMGGFSNQDRPGGVIEDPELRVVCASVLESTLSKNVPVTRLDAHLFAPEVTCAITETLSALSAKEQSHA